MDDHSGPSSIANCVVSIDCNGTVDRDIFSDAADNASAFLDTTNTMPTTTTQCGVKDVLARIVRAWNFRLRGKTIVTSTNSNGLFFQERPQQQAEIVVYVHNLGKWTKL